MKQQQFSYPYSSHQENFQHNNSNLYNRNDIGKNIMKENYYNPSPIKYMEPKINYHFSNKTGQEPDNFKEKGRRKFPAPESEIKKAHIFSVPDDPLEHANANGNTPNNNLMFLDRNLDTHDIPGSKPGTLQSKVVKNKEMAQKINEFNKKQQGNLMRDSLDLFQNNYNAPEEQNIYNMQNQHFNNEEDFFQESSRDFHKNNHENYEKQKFVAPSNEKRNFSAAPKQEKLENEEEDEDFLNFKKNYSNFYRGYTPDEFSKRKYAQAKKILQAYENIKDDLKMIEIEKEKRIIDDPEFNKSLNLFFGVEEKKPKKNQSPHKKKNPSIDNSKEDLSTLQKEIAETEERLRKLYLANNVTKEIIPKPSTAVQKKLNPTYLSYAGSEISSNYQDKKKYEVDVIGNIVKRNEEMNKSFHTIDGIKRFGAGLKNLNQEATLNPIPKRYSEKYQ